MAQDMPLEQYSLREVSSVASYLLKCSVSFSSYEAARRGFEMALRTETADEKQPVRDEME